jgi:hypothetical protein
MAEKASADAALAEVRSMLERLPTEVPGDNNRQILMRNWCIETSLKLHELIMQLNSLQVL